MRNVHVDEKKLLLSNTLLLGAASLLRMVIQVGMLPLMAALVGPAEFGTFALVMPTISFFNLLADGGLGESLARVDESDKKTWSTGFWAILSLCLVLCIIVTLSGYLISFFSGQERVRYIMIFMAPTFILLAISAVPHARLTRRGMLKIHVLSDLMGLTISSIVAVTMAFRGFGVWSLVWQYVLYAVCRSVILNYYAFEKLDFIFRFDLLKDHLRIGTSMISGKLLDFVGRIVENTLFGGFFGASTLGAYSLANQSCRYIVEVFTNPTWGSLYAYSLKHDLGEAVRAHRKLSRVLSYFLVPLGFFMSALAPSIFLLLMGKQWGMAAQLFQIVLPTFTIAAIAGQSSAVLYANAFSLPALIPAVIYFSLRVLIVSIGYKIGPFGIMWGISVLNIFYALAFYAALKMTRAITLYPQIRDLSYPVASAAATAATLALLTFNYPILSVYEFHLYLIFIVFVIMMTIYAILIMLFNGRQIKSDIWSIWRMVRR